LENKPMVLYSGLSFFIWVKNNRTHPKSLNSLLLTF
jgi:hypothetical protein